ncbi:putative glutathione S-transferase [Xylariaceae sp. FL0804]|nr:putative glutathione S-transferase [Xylariaceae sp. FL0804]
MSYDEIVFFDLGSKSPGGCWSLNTWKTRFVLNFKELNYKTEWLEYPDIKPRLEDHFPRDKESLTCPTVLMPDGSYVMDSYLIAELIEEKHPEPSLHLDSPVIQKIKDQMPAIMKALGPIYVPQVVKRLLTEYNHPYWYRTREEWVGMPLEQFEREQGGEQAFIKAEEPLRAVTSVLRDNGDGPFFMGKTVSFADFIWAGFLIFFRRIGDDVFERLLEATGDQEAHLKLLEAVRPWSERDHH